MTPEERQQLLQYATVIREVVVCMELMAGAMRRAATSLESWSEVMTREPDPSTAGH